MILGILASAGHDPVAIMDRWTWPQIGAVARSILASKVWALKLVVGPLLPEIKSRTGLDISLPSTAGTQAMTTKRSTSIDLNDPAAVARAKKRDDELAALFLVPGISLSDE